MRAPAPVSLVASLPDVAAELLARLRSKKPRVHCLTNTVAQALTANVLLAADAIPSMTTAPEEVVEFVDTADALVVNLGTLDRERREAMQLAAESFGARQRPWVLDPVFVDRSQARCRFARQLMKCNPALVRLNASEFASLAGVAPDETSISYYARRQNCVVALTGSTDILADGTRLVRIANGDALMARVSAMGCAATALAAAFIAVEDDPLLASAAGLLAFAVAGECAAQRARGPGSFAVEIVDQLAMLDRATLVRRARLS